MPQYEIPTATTISRPAASTQVQTTFAHIDSRMPAKTSPASNRRKPMTMTQSGQGGNAQQLGQIGGKDAGLRGH